MSPVANSRGIGVRLAAAAARAALVAAACLPSCSRHLRPTDALPAPTASLSPASSAPAARTAPSETPGPTTTPPVAARDGRPHYSVGTFSVDLTDTARQRTLHTIIHFPALGAAGQPGTEPAHGPFPLVVMAHGFQLPASGYERILSMVTAAGYLVAAPAFPHTSAESGQGDRSDIVNQPADLSFVVDAVTAMAARQPPTLPPVADPTRVAAMGHSDGGLTVSAWAYNNLYRDRRVAAAVVMSGGMALFPGTYFAADSPPLLAIHATDDETNPYAASLGLLDAVPAGIPAFLLTIAGGSHLGPYMYDTARADVAQVVIDFLDGYFLGDPGGRQRMLADADHPGQLALRSR